MFKKVVIAAAAALNKESAPLVPVELYYESQWPGCESFTTSTLANTLAKDDMAAIIDWHSKAILSYKLSNCMDSSLVTTILQEALAKYPAPLIFNSDQGSQYTGSEHINILKTHSVKISMNGKGRSIDNIAIERFFRTLKYNCIFINEFNNILELKEVISEYVNKYNNKRFHSSIGYKKPMNVYLEALKNAAW